MSDIGQMHTRLIDPVSGTGSLMPPSDDSSSDGMFELTFGLSPLSGGAHVFEVDDTEPLPNSQDCTQPHQTWQAIPVAGGLDDSFYCTRFCKEGHVCNCGWTTGVRCEVYTVVHPHLAFNYRLQQVDAVTSASLDGTTFSGRVWEVTVEDLTHVTPTVTVGRVLLSGAVACL